MLAKDKVELDVKSPENVRQLSTANLLHFEFKLNVCIMQVKPLLSVLKKLGGARASHAPKIPTDLPQYINK